MSLAKEFPQIAAQWHPTKNGDLTPDQVTSGSHKKIWWHSDDCGHDWPSMIMVRTAKHSGCSVCSGSLLVPGINDLATTRPDLAVQWHPTKNGDLTPDQVSAGVNTIAIWFNKECGHDWPARVSSRSAKTADMGCPICTNKILVPGINDLATIRPDIAALWHPTKNGSLTPKDVKAGGKPIIWLACAEHGHPYSGTLVDFVLRDRKCDVCSGRRGFLGYNSILDNPDLASEWDYEKNGDPAIVSLTTTKFYAWVCNKKAHHWDDSPANRSQHNHICKVCAGRLVLVGDNDLATVDPKLATEWDYEKNGALTPQQVTRGSGKLVWWTCKKHPSWQARVVDRATKEYGCARCSNAVSLAEQKIFDFLKDEIAVIQKDRSALGGMEIDIYSLPLKRGVEFNGLYWHADTRRASGNKVVVNSRAQNHYLKWEKAQQAGVTLFQIWEDDWNRNPELIKVLLANKFGFSDLPKIAARKTAVEAISKTDAEEFLLQNHIQGYASGSLYLGLKHEEKLVALLVVKKIKDADYEIIRYATSANVRGGFSKLLKHAQVQLQATKFVTFSDHTVSDGGLYANNGFVADKEIKPDYMYVVNGERKHKFGYRLKRFRDDPALQYQEGLSERELAALNNIPRIWDAGKTRWSKTYV